MKIGGNPKHTGWLSDRIDHSKLPIAHRALTEAPTLSVDITQLSTAIVETLEPGFVPEGAPRTVQVERWSTVISSSWFRDGLRRLLTGKPSDDEARQSKLQAARVAVFKLADVALEPVNALRSRFQLVHSTTDVTATAEGSTGLITGSKLYLVAPRSGRKHQQLVELTRQVNHGPTPMFGAACGGPS